MRKSDEYGKEVEKGDWIAYKNSRGLRIGVIESFTPRGYPRIIKYDEGYRDLGESPFGNRETSTSGLGFVKISPMTDESPFE